MFFLETSVFFYLFKGCIPDPCINGVCKDCDDGTFNCLCDPGYEGKLCDTIEGKMFTVVSTLSLSFRKVALLIFATFILTCGFFLPN